MTDSPRTLHAAEQRTVVVVFNPAAGHGRAGRARRALEAALRHASARGPADLEPSNTQARASSWQIVETTGPGSAVELARRAAEAGADVVAAAGGDGTFGEVANGLVGTRAALGLVPLGTGNDFARSVGIGHGVGDSVWTLWTGAPRSVDLCHAQSGPSSRYVLNAAGCGFDVAVAERVNRGYRWLGGPAAYVAAVLESLRDFRPIGMRLTVDESSWTLNAMLCVVSNGSTLGGGMRIAPAARPDDGLLDVCVVSEASRWDLLRTLPRVYRGTHTTHPKVAMRQGRRIRIETTRPVPLLADGEIVGLTPAELTVAPRAIAVVAPMASRRPA